MRIGTRITATLAIALLVGVVGGFGDASPDWAMNATAIEACSCPMFCQCYFNPMPAEHHDMDHGYCKFNNAYRVNRGHYGGVKLDGAKFWLSGDLGAEFADGEMEWVVATFDRSLSKEQREALGAILPKLFPVKWKSFQTAEGDITWSHQGDTARATLDGGKTAEVNLKSAKGLTSGPVVMKNLAYWGAPRNDGFVMMPNQLQAYRVGDKAYEFKGTNGFMITLDMNSKDFAKPAAAAKPGQ